ncbi:bacteriophage CI repressor helix-turn-helix domain protein [Escherichia coli PA7]|uniref:hypothetical protein n=1 Tax=Escherichia coli TaxID=562 RepID=UPI00028BFE49|nr:hypothetical protein [Escherichia coli]EKH01961.1 bacteriophage CI repressor helix-turn-helix domain protein [Escherichia coli PA7]
MFPFPWLPTGKEDTNREALDDDEKALLDVYRNLPPVERRNMLAAFQMRLQKTDRILLRIR